MKEADDQRLAELTAPRIEARGGKVEGGPSLVEVCALLKSRSATLEKLADAALFFYREPNPDPEAVKASLENGGREALALFGKKLAELPENASSDDVYHVIQAVMTELGCPMKVLATPLRVVVCAADRTPQIDKTLCLIGLKNVCRRIEEGLAKF